jgi:hypothetical protein
MKSAQPNDAPKPRVIRRVKSLLLNREIEMDLTEVAYVLGTRDVVTPWSTERRCALCDHPVYTSLVYPEECGFCASSVSPRCQRTTANLYEQRAI